MSKDVQDDTYVAPTDDAFHAMMQRYFKSQPQTICVIKRQGDDETKDEKVDSLLDSLQSNLVVSNGDDHGGRELEHVPHDVHGVHGAHEHEHDDHGVQDAHDATGHTILHGHFGQVQHPCDGLHPVREQGCSNGQGPNTEAKLPQDGASHHEPSQDALPRDAYGVSSCDVL